MIVVDTNVIAYLWIPGERTESAEKLLQKDSEWITPVLWRSEFRNVLAEYLRLNKLTLKTAIQTINEAESFFKNKQYFVNSQKVLELISKSNCSAYDCEFVVLAQDFSVSLVTTDKKIIRAFPQTAISLKDFLQA